MELPQLFLRDLFWLVLVVCSNVAASADDDPGTMSNEELVAALVSENRMPDVGTPAKSIDKPPAGYDRKAQDKVYAAWNELLNRDESVFPLLIARIGDKRYSVTEDTGPLLRNIDVGGVCLRILAAKLDPAKRFTRRPGFPSYAYDVIYDPLRKENLAKRLDVHRERSLVELQIESYTWFLDQKISESIPQADQEKMRGMVRKALADLKQSKEPYQPPPHKPQIRF